MTTKADFLEFYQHNARYFEAAEQGNDNGLLAVSHRWTLAYVKALSGKRVCDFGCGSGANIQEMYSTGNTYVGADVSVDALQEAQNKVPGTNVRYLKLSGAYPLPIASGHTCD
jgi:2-polyprenyl-3-methyl-5-hydroxy-6-metoxy-1,4-benzoquinol methylase